MNARGQRSGAQHHGEVLGLLRSECAFDDAAVTNRVIDAGDLAHALVEHDGETVADVRAGELLEAAAGGSREVKADGGGGLAVLALAGAAYVTARAHPPAGDERGLVPR